MTELSINLVGAFLFFLLFIHVYHISLFLDALHWVSGLFPPKLAFLLLK